MKRNDDGGAATEGDGEEQDEEQRRSVEPPLDETGHWDIENLLIDDREFLYEDERWSRDD